MKHVRHWWIAPAFSAALGVVACSDNTRPEVARTAPPPTPVNTAAPTVAPATAPDTPSVPGTTSSDVPPSASATETVEAKKGTEGTGPDASSGEAVRTDGY